MSRAKDGSGPRKRPGRPKKAKSRVLGYTDQLRREILGVEDFMLDLEKRRNDNPVWAEGMLRHYRKRLADLEARLALLESGKDDAET